MLEFLVGALVRPDGVDAELVAVLKPGGDLFDCGLFEVGRERSLTG